MNKKPNTKRALTLSLLSLLLCVSLLVGSTFAWFTDVETTNVNTIQSGTLEIDLLDKSGNSLEGTTLDFVDLDSHKFWEPGATNTLPTVVIRNSGNLAVKYKVEITGIKGDAKLNEVIDWTIDYGYGTGETEGHLVPGQDAEITISGTMQTTAGNDYQNLTIDGIAITVYATQDTVEFDSATDQYDAQAAYAVVNQKAFEEAVAGAQAGETINLGDTTIELTNDIPAGVSITGNGSNTVLSVPDQAGVNAGAGAIISNVTITDNATQSGSYTGTINLQGDGATLENVTVNGKGGGTWDAAVAVKLKAGETAYITNTEINGGFRGIFAGSQSGNVVIDGCTINPTAYAINVDGGSDQSLVVNNSTVNGWTSYSSVVTATFTNCKMGGTNYKYLVPYGTTTLTNCEFADGYILISGSNCGEFTITIDNCTYDGEKLTADNIVEKLFDETDSDYANMKAKVTVIVDGTPVVYK